MNGLLHTVLVGLAFCGPVAAAEPRYSAELVFPLRADHNHAPGIVETARGDLWVSWYRGSGERTADELRAWRAAGADRYLLRFETSDRALYDFIHPGRGGLPSDRLALLRTLRDLGYEVGSGVMIGIPGQSYEDLARDIQLFGELDLDMIGVGPFLPHPGTPLGDPNRAETVADQVPNSELMTYKVIALARLTCPRANIPSTTALATLNRLNGRELGLARGANVVMPNLTPLDYRALYEIYPGKAKVIDTAEEFHKNLLATLVRIGRVPGRGRGSRRGRCCRASATATDAAPASSATSRARGNSSRSACGRLRPGAGFRNEGRRDASCRPPPRPGPAHRTPSAGRGRD